jgi:hypothetical protein
MHVHCFMKIFQLLLKIVHSCSLFHEKGDILVFDSSNILLPSWLSGKVSSRQHYSREFAPHSVGFRHLYVSLILS